MITDEELIISAAGNNKICRCLCAMADDSHNVTRTKISITGSGMYLKENNIILANVIGNLSGEMADVV